MNTSTVIRLHEGYPMGGRGQNYLLFLVTRIEQKLMKSNISFSWGQSNPKLHVLKYRLASEITQIYGVLIEKAWIKDKFWLTLFHDLFLFLFCLKNKKYKKKCKNLLNSPSRGNFVDGLPRAISKDFHKIWPGKSWFDFISFFFKFPWQKTLNMFALHPPQRAVNRQPSYRARDCWVVLRVLCSIYDRKRKYFGTRIHIFFPN